MIGSGNEITKSNKGNIRGVYASMPKDQKAALNARNYARHKDQQRAYAKVWAAELKLQTMSHYGPQGKLQCSWPECQVVDPDMLCLDHINDDGAKERKVTGLRGGGETYYTLRANGYPEGYQTLCANHNLKKEIMRKRS